MVSSLSMCAAGVSRRWPYRQSGCLDLPADLSHPIAILQEIKNITQGDVRLPEHRSLRWRQSEIMQLHGSLSCRRRGRTLLLLTRTPNPTCSGNA